MGLNIWIWHEVQKRTGSYSAYSCCWHVPLETQCHQGKVCHSLIQYREEYITCSQLVLKVATFHAVNQTSCKDGKWNEPISFNKDYIYYLSGLGKLLVSTWSGQNNPTVTHEKSMPWFQTRKCSRIKTASVLYLKPEGQHLSASRLLLEPQQPQGNWPWDLESLQALDMFRICTAHEVYSRPQQKQKTFVVLQI